MERTLPACKMTVAALNVSVTLLAAHSDRNKIEWSGFRESLPHCYSSSVESVSATFKSILLVFDEPGN